MSGSYNNSNVWQLIGRVDADPDVMPRLNNFGLNVFEFRAQFCSGCPEAFWRIAFLCCSLDPDHRPPFSQSRLWLDSLCLDTATSCLSSTAFLNELDHYLEREFGGRRFFVIVSFKKATYFFKCAVLVLALRFFNYFCSPVNMLNLNSFAITPQHIKI